MQEAPLMPKATAVWLVENTALSFDQVAEFCKLHPLEVKAIADGDAAQGIKGLDPIQTGQLTREEIEKGVAEPDHKLLLSRPKVGLPEAKPGQFSPARADAVKAGGVSVAEVLPVALSLPANLERRRRPDRQFRLLLRKKTTIRTLLLRASWEAVAAA